MLSLPDSPEQPAVPTRVFFAGSDSRAHWQARAGTPLQSSPLCSPLATASSSAGSKSLGPIGKRVRAANSVLERDGAAIVAAFAPDKKAEGLAALDDLKKVRAMECLCLLFALTGHSCVVLRRTRRPRAWLRWTT